MHPHERSFIGCLWVCGIGAFLLFSTTVTVGAIVWKHTRLEKPPVGCNGSPMRGRALVVAYGCPACHDVPDAAPHGEVGPTLQHMASRPYIAGRATNEPITMAAWLRNPQRIKPGTAMPNLGIGDRDARDITAYLATLK